MVEGEGFTRSPHDLALYTRKLGTKDEVCLTAYVDDCIWHAGSTQAAKQFRSAMDKKWGDMGTKPADYILGLNVKTVREKNGRKHLRLSAEENIRRVSAKFLHTELGPTAKRSKRAMTDTSEADRRQEEHATVSTPFRPGDVVDLLDCLPDGERTQVDYRGLVGSLQWLATTCRPDIAFCVSQLARVQARPGPRHWAMALNVAKYLEQSAEQGIWYSQTQDDERGRILAYCDASWADTPGHVSNTPDPNGYKSTGGHVVYLNGGAISWASRTQTITALSSTESELYATCDAAKDITHLRWIMGDLGREQQGPTPLLCDNQPCLNLLKDSHASTSRRSRHIELRWFYAREQQHIGTINMIKVPTKDNIADIMTKGLGKVLHDKFTVQLTREQHDDNAKYRLDFTPQRTATANPEDKERTSMVSCGRRAGQQGQVVDRRREVSTQLAATYEDSGTRWELTVRVLSAVPNHRERLVSTTCPRDPHTRGWASH